MRAGRLVFPCLFPLLLLVARADAQQLDLQVESEELHANLPFVLTVLARGFAEEPQPSLSKLAIPGCKVTPLGVTPNVSSMVQVVNGRRSEYRNVSFAFRFRIEAPQPGTYSVPTLVAEQGGKRAEGRPARLQVKALEETRDMQVRLVLPERPVWVGETFNASLEWYLRRDVSNRTFVVPLFDEDGWLEAEPEPGNEPRLGGFHAGARQLELPYRRDKASLDGAEYTRFRFLVRITPIKAGLLTARPPRVVAELETGYGRDGFGFPMPMTKLFSATGKPVRLEIRPLPQQGRPESFKNAVGTAFSIEVQAGRTVVRVGDPIELKILIRGNGRLAGLILPDLHAAGLSRELFAVPGEPVTGELLDDGKGKLFRVSVRLKSTKTTKIPALSFSYFDPDKGTYHTSQSQPIALSVQGSALVGAQDVIDAAPERKKEQGAEKQAEPPALSLVGAELALSDERTTLRRAASVGTLAPWLVLFYGLPVLFFLVQRWRLRTRKSREHQDEARKLLRRLQQELHAASREPAREAAPRLLAILRALRRQLGQRFDEPLLARLETEAYSPDAAQQPLNPTLLKEIQELAAGWAAHAGRNSGQSSGAATLGLLLVVGFGLDAPRTAFAAGEEPMLQQARNSYRLALSRNGRDQRRSEFARAEALYRELGALHPECPELLTDWGNAALLAQEPGRAVLAYRRALRLDPSAERARRNLGFLRDRLPEWLPRPRSPGAIDSLFFWYRLWSRPTLHLILAVNFAILLLLLTPWSMAPGHRRLLRGAAAVAAASFATLALSLLLERDQSADGVLLVHGAVLRSADSLGAPPALGHPLPAGAEVTVLSARNEWARIELADGQNGWVPTSTVERVDRPQQAAPVALP